MMFTVRVYATSQNCLLLRRASKAPHATATAPTPPERFHARTPSTLRPLLARSPRRGRHAALATTRHDGLLHVQTLLLDPRALLDAFLRHRRDENGDALNNLRNGYIQGVLHDSFQPIFQLDEALRDAPMRELDHTEVSSSAQSRTAVCVANNVFTRQRFGRQIFPCYTAKAQLAACFGQSVIDEVRIE